MHNQIRQVNSKSESIEKISDDLEEKKALIGECITKLGKSTASQMPVNKLVTTQEKKRH